MATLSYTAAQIDTLLGKADTAVQPTTTGDLDNLATSTKTDLVSAINETFQSASNGKALVAAAITDKGVTTAATDSYATMASNIAAIPTGTTEAEEKDVNFIDYDGTILYSYTKAEFANLSALPDNPSHTGLIARGWNWTLSDAKTYVAANGGLWIGQLYYDANGATEIDIQLEQGRLAPYLGLGVNGTVTIDWGDNSSADTVTGTSLTTQKTTQHTYSAPGKYTIKITPTSGSFALRGNGSYCVLGNNTTNANYNRVYSAAICAVRLGTNVGLGTYAFYAANNLHAIVLTPSISVANYVFSTTNGLIRISLPNNGSYGTNVFNGAITMRSLCLPTSLTSIPNAFCNNCSALSSVTVPAEVGSIGASAFASCYGLGEIHFKPTSPPTVSNSNTWTSLPTDCKIYVPTGKLSAYTSASYYPDPNTYTYVEE